MIDRLPLQLMMPVAVLLAAYLAVPYVSALPVSLSGLGQSAPYIVIALGSALSIAFQRGRALFALLALGAAQLARHVYLQPGAPPVHAYTAFACICILVPANLAVLSVLRERGVWSAHGMGRLAILLAQVALVMLLVRTSKAGFAAAAYVTLIDTRVLATSPIPQSGLLFATTSLAVAVGAWLIRRSGLELGLAGAILAFGIAAHNITSPNAFEIYIAAAAVILMTAVLQDTFRMAFRDELTGLPSRRALNERLGRLPRRYTVAMVDVDRFKGLNDRFGHDVGDQVLKLVATRLARVAGGGKVYRYGGEEFTVLFPGKTVDQALPYLEDLREDIAQYKLSLRDPARSEAPAGMSKRRGQGGAGRPVSVTISIGVADKVDRSVKPEDVIHAADKALYRAKNRGRNQVSL